MTLGLRCPVCHEGLTRTAEAGPTPAGPVTPLTSPPTAMSTCCSPTSAAAASPATPRRWCAAAGPSSTPATMTAWRPHWCRRWAAPGRRHVRARRRLRRGIVHPRHRRRHAGRCRRVRCRRVQGGDHGRRPPRPAHCLRRRQRLRPPRARRLCQRRRQQLRARRRPGAGHGSLDPEARSSPPTPVPITSTPYARSSTTAPSTTK